MLVKKLRKERQEGKDRNRKKLQDALERNIQKLSMKETALDIERAKLQIAKRDERLRASQESIKSREEEIAGGNTGSAPAYGYHYSQPNSALSSADQAKNGRNSQSLRPMRKISSSLHEIPENTHSEYRHSLNRSVIDKDVKRSPLKPILRLPKRAMPLYKQIEMQYEAQQEIEERDRIQKLRDHRMQYNVVSFKNVLARQTDQNYDDKLRQR